METRPSPTSVRTPGVLQIGRLHLLPDYLRPGLDIVFVGLNPGTRSARVGHYYAGRGNQFWSFLFEAAFTDRPLAPEEDALILSYNIGLTDLVKRSTPRAGDLANAEFRSDFPLLRSKIGRVRPRIVCFNGKIGYEKAVGHRYHYGLQGHQLEGVPVFLAPSTSGSLPMRRSDKLAFYRELKALTDRR